MDINESSESEDNGEDNTIKNSIHGVALVLSFLHATAIVDHYRHCLECDRNPSF